MFFVDSVQQYICNMFISRNLFIRYCWMYIKETMQSQSSMTFPEQQPVTSKVPTELIPSSCEDQKSRAALLRWCGEYLNIWNQGPWVYLRIGYPQKEYGCWWNFDSIEDMFGWLHIFPTLRATDWLNWCHSHGNVKLISRCSADASSTMIKNIKGLPSGKQRWQWKNIFI